MKRPMTLVSGILGLVSHVMNLVFTFMNIALVFALIADLEYNPEATGAFIAALILVVISLTISIVVFVFSILALTTWNKAPEVYKSKKSKIIVAIVFAFLGIVASYLVSNMIVAILTTLMFIAAAVLAIVDLCLENKRLAAAGVTAENATEEAAPAVEAAPATKADDIEAKIEKLNDMKANGLINDEEYEELKKKYIREKLGM